MGKTEHGHSKQDNGYALLKHADTEIKRHTLVNPEASPYDGNWTYWSKRRGEYPETPTRVAKLLKKQKGLCNYCHQSFTPDDIVEADHIIPKSKGGKDEYKNLQLLHRHCHDQKTRYDGSLERNFKPVVPLPEDYRWENDILVTVPMTRVN